MMTYQYSIDPLLHSPISTRGRLLVPTDFPTIGVQLSLVGILLAKPHIMSLHLLFGLPNCSSLAPETSSKKKGEWKDCSFGFFLNGIPKQNIHSSAWSYIHNHLIQQVLHPSLTARSFVFLCLVRYYDFIQLHLFLKSFAIHLVLILICT